MKFATQISRCSLNSKRLGNTALAHKKCINCVQGWNLEFLSVQSPCVLKVLVNPKLGDIFVDMVGCCLDCSESS